jgi:hypothetical protein
MHGRTKRLVGVLAACSLLVGALATGAGAASDTSSSKGTGPSSASDKVVKVMTYQATGTTATNAPDAAKVAQAVVDDLNAKNGAAINGYKIQLTICGPNLAAGTAEAAGPAKSEECARKAVSEGDVAMVAPFDTAAQAALPILEQAGMAYLGSPCVCTPLDLTSKVSFPLIAGTAVTGAGLAQLAANDKCKKISNFQLDLAAADTIPAFFEAGLKVVKNAPKFAGTTRIPVNFTDPSSLVANATDGVDCVMYENAVNTPAIMTAWQQAGVKAHISAVDLFSPQDMATFGKGSGPLNGASISLSLPASASKAWDPFFAVMKKYGGDLGTRPRSDFASTQKNIWVGFQGFANVLNHSSGAVTRTSVMNYLNGASAFDIGHPQIVPVLNLSKEFPLAGANRLFNRSVIFGSIKEGIVTTPKNAKFVDVSKLVEACTNCLSGS